VAFLLLALLAAASPACAAQPMAAPSIEQLARQADIVVIGQVISATGECAAPPSRRGSPRRSPSPRDAAYR
jgi:hypothetical protein